MASLRDIKRRIQSVKNTRQITKAMKMVSGAKLKRATDRAVAARPYQESLSRVLGRVAAAAARASLQRGGGELIEVAMAEVAAAYAAIPAPATDATPKRPVITGVAPELGAATTTSSAP